MQTGFPPTTPTTSSQLLCYQSTIRGAGMLKRSSAAPSHRIKKFPIARPHTNNHYVHAAGGTWVATLIARLVELHHLSRLGWLIICRWRWHPRSVGASYPARVDGQNSAQATTTRITTSMPILRYYRRNFYRRV
jgi:hypothetical protein